MRITFVIPVLNERHTLEPLVEGIAAHVAPHDYGIVFVDDGSTDGSYDVLVGLAARNPHVEAVRLRGNFGKSAALAVGFSRADGDLVFTMDSDLQDDPKEIPRFLEKVEEGYDVVCGWKAVRRDPWHKRIPSRIYNRIVSWLYDLPLHDVNCGFKAFRREVVTKFNVYGELHRLLPVFAHGMNYRIGEIQVEHHARKYGHSKYGVRRFGRGAVDVLTLWFVTRYLHRPAHFFAGMGFIQLTFGLLGIVAGLILFGIEGVGAAGVGLCLLGALLVVGGYLSILIGLLAELVLRQFAQVDPTFYIAEESQTGIR